MKTIYIPNSKGGLWHYLKCIGSCIDIAIESKRNIIIDTIKTATINCNFSELFDICNPIIKCDDNSINNSINNYKPYLGLPDNINDIVNREAVKKGTDNVATYLPKKLDINSFDEYKNQICTKLSNLETIILFSGFLDSNAIIKIMSIIKINMETKSVVNQLYDTLPKQYIGIHYRDTDYTGNFDEVCSQLEDKIVKHNCYNIFIATDNTNIIHKFIEKYPKCNFSWNKQINTNVLLENKNKETGLHHVSSEKWEEIGLHKHNSHQNFLAEIYCIIKATDFITTAGNNINLIPLLRKNDNLRKNFYRESDEPLNL